MSYTKYSDPAALISEICHPLTADEKIKINDLGVDFRDEEFAKAYFMETKRHYLKYLQEKELNTAKLWTFTDLDNTIRNHISTSYRTQNKEVPLLPEYTNFDNKDKHNNPQNLLARIAKLRNSQPDKT
jgi:hypothetical protein